MYTIAVANQKGGSGKTTTSVNLASCLAELGKKVMLVDLDPQSQTTTHFRIEDKNIKQSIFDVLLNKGSHINGMAHSINDCLTLVPSKLISHDQEARLLMSERRMLRLKDILMKIDKKTDVVVIDCPPNLGLLTYNALLASDAVLLTVETSFFALHGVSRLLDVIKEIKQKYDHSIRSFVLATMYDGRTKLAGEVLGDMKNFFKDVMLKTVIRRTVKLTEAASVGLPINEYRRSSRGFEDYMSLAKELGKKASL